MKLFRCGFAVAGLAFFLFSCGSAPKPDSSGEPYTASPDDAVSIALSPKREVSFFVGIPDEAVSAIENGSPASIRQAYGLLRKDASLYSDNEKILLDIGYYLMAILWPSENSGLERFDVSSANSYLGAIDSARQGIYDESTGNTDFLSTVLPSLVLVTSSSRSDYYELSAAALDKALAMKSGSVLANYLRGVLCRRQQDFSSALAYFKSAYDGSPDTIEIIYALADCNYSNKNYASSLELSRKLLDTNPAYTPALKLCAESSFASGDLDASEQYVARVLQQEPENAYYVLFRAKILMEKGDYIRAASLLDVYARTDSENREYLVLRAKVQKDWNRNMTAASATIEKALSLYPDDTEIVLAAASLASETGAKINGKTAGELAQTVLEKDADNVEAMKIQVDELVAEKRWNEAYIASGKLQSMRNASADSLYTHIDICLAAGKMDEAWSLSSSLYSKNPKDENVLQNYIKVLVAAGRRTEAASVISQSMQGASSRMRSFLYYERSFLQTSQDAALVDLRSSLTANPRNKDSLFRLYQIYYDRKEYRKAQYYLKQVVSLAPSDTSLLSLNSELETLLSK